MASPRLRFFSVLLAAVAAGFCAWIFLPSSPLDRALVGAVVRSFANPPFQITGKGSRAEPWSLRMISPYRKSDPAHAPTIVSLGDDPEGIFQTSPPSPVDLAVILKNLRRLGAKKPAISAILAWEKPDSIALAALDSEFAEFSTAVTAAPLSRAANTSALPPSFRRASIPLDRISGDISALPIVNRVSLPGVILGGDSAFSGFTILENELVGNAPLIARWDDRAVLAFPLVAVLAQRGLPPENVEVDLGNFIKLGPGGPIIPVDRFGRIATSPQKPGRLKTIPADALIDATDPLPLRPETIVLLRDDQSSGDTGSQAFSRTVAPLIAAISSEAGWSRERKFLRATATKELALLGAISVLLASFSSLRRFARHLSFGLVAAVILVAHQIAAADASLWFPSLAALASVFAALVFSRIFFHDRPRSIPVIPVPLVAGTDTEIVSTAPKIQTAAIVPPPTSNHRKKKSAAKKIPPAKKSVTKKSTRPKKSPPGKS